MKLAIIPARAGSERIPFKNLLPLCGKPLVFHTLAAAIQAQTNGAIDDIVVTTDIPDFCSVVGISDGYTVIKRPDELAQGQYGSLIPVLQHAVKTYEERNEWLVYVDDIVLLQPTSPLRTNNDIVGACTLYQYRDSPMQALYSGYKIGIKSKGSLYDKHAPKHFQRNGAIFITPRDLLMKQDKLWDEDAIEYEMPLSRSFDIDTWDDYYICDSLLNREVYYERNPDR